MKKKIDFKFYDDIEDKVLTISSGNELSQIERFADLIFWIDENKKHIPLDELVNRKAISENKNKEFEIFKLLSRAAKNNATPLFKAGNIPQSDKRNVLVTIWQGLINKKAKDLHNLPQYKNNVDKYFISDLIKKSIDISFIPSISDYLKYSGIGFIIEPTLPGLGVDGLVYKNKKDNPIIALSLRYDRLDNFWFTLAHELSHIALHYERLDNAIIEDLDLTDISEIEDEANYFASEAIISSSVWRRCEFRRKQTEDSLNELANSQGIHPIILAGKLRNETSNYELFSKLVHKYSVRELLSK
ncbi:ImmA/IrrE family metallo-endopeptidase [Pectobacterium sp. CHL-2024]|uniref:ImmA/IrrE family metallo-endopeptidase n=1 Tax=Pectobacterium sp. CHL-2024 TaxID=3377079 RepID=UPI003801D098